MKLYYGTNKDPDNKNKQTIKCLLKKEIVEHRVQYIIQKTGLYKKNNYFSAIFLWRSVTNLMADTIDCLKSSSHINTATADTIELNTSREDIRMVLKRSFNILAESTLESKSTLHLSLGLLLVGLASSIITAITFALISRESLETVQVAAAGFVTNLANLDTKELVLRHSKVNDTTNHTVNIVDNITLSLQNIKSSSRGLKLIVKLGKFIRNKVLRNSSLITSNVHLTSEGRNRVGVLQEAKEGFLLEAEITILARSSWGVSLSIDIRIIKDGSEISVKTVFVDGTNPTMRPAGSNISTELSILKASIRRSASRSRGGNIDIVSKVLPVEHGTRIAGRHEEDELLEHLLALHGVKASGKIIIVEKLISRHGNDTRTTVVIVEDENIILLSGLQDLARTRSSGITRKNIDKVLNGSITSDIILDNTFINIDVGTTLNVQFVEDLTRERILTVVGNIILEESDDTLIRNTSLVSKLVCLVDRGLVTIVTPASATSNKNDPGYTITVLACLKGRLEHIVLLVCKNESSQKEQIKEAFHRYW